MRRIKASHLLMTSGPLIATIIGIMAAVLSHARADWVSDIGSIGLSATIDAGKAPGMLDPRVNTIANLLTLTNAVPETVKRQQDYNHGLGTTLKDQALVSVAGWGAGKVLSTTLIAPCFASGVCAIVGAGSAVATGSALALVGAGYDTVLAGKIVEGLVAYGHEREQQIASEQYAKILQQRVDEQRILKQLLQTQQSTPQWQEQRSQQLALQKIVGQTTPPPNVSSGPAPSGASGLVPAASSQTVQSPNAPATGAVPSTNPNLQMYSFKPLANGNIEIYENGKPISTGSGFTRSYAQSLGYLPPLSQQTATSPSVASGSVPAASSPSVQPPNAPASGAVPSTNPNLQMYSFKPLANGNVEIYENGKPISTGSGFTRSYAQSLGYSSPLPQQTAIAPSAASPSISSAASSSNYTFTPTQYGTIQVSRNGQIIATTTPQLAAQAYGYPLNTPAPSPTSAPITSGYVTTPSGAVVNVATGQLVSPPPNVSRPNAGPVQSTNLPSQPMAVPPSAKPPSSVGPTVQAPQSNTQVASRSPAPNASVSSPSISSPAPGAGAMPRAVGGISLSRAAADRMPLEIALDALALSDGKLVLSGRSSKTRMDAALFLTALRAACDDRDPYFSLDPDNGALWSQQGDQASNEFWERIKKDFPSNTPARAKNAQPGVNIRTVSVTQDYPGIWQDISPHYPNFRAKLVFYPEWLRQTRLGEVLYKADVLLKELSSGVSILVPGKLRASAIPGYLSADVEYAAKGLLAGTRDQLAGRPQWRGSRLWFEITPSELPTTIVNEATAPPSSDNPSLRSLLQSKGLIRSADQSVHNASFFMRHGSVFDLSQVNPIMFVRVHDHATNQDLSDHDPRLDGLATDVSARFDQYAQYYDELRLLREVFRAYIAARKIMEVNERLCDSLDAMPFLDSEKLTTRLPDYHPSELFVTIASYSTVSRKGSQTQFVKASSMSGGVSIAGQKFAETAMRDGETTVTRAVEAAIAGVNDGIDSDRKFISFIVDDGSGAPVRLASNARDPLAPRSLSDYPIENEPTPSAIPPSARISARGQNDAVITVVATLLILGFALNYLTRRNRGARR